MTEAMSSGDGKRVDHQTGCACPLLQVRVLTVPAPSVFISSTFYDLRYIRENLRFFVRSLGYNPILSERGTIFFDPHRTAAQAAVAEVHNCQLFVLIIGGRYGTELDAEQSVTNAEYQEAIRQKVPVFALVERGTFADFEVWRANSIDGVDLSEMAFPNADDKRIFAFIEEVRAQGANNALVPFADFEDIEKYLRQQWAGLLHSFLSQVKEEGKVSETLSGLERISRRVEVLSTQILESVGTTETKLMAELYDRMLGSEAIQRMLAIGLKPTPADVLDHDSFIECTEALGGRWNLADDEDDTISHSRIDHRGTMAQWNIERHQEDYEELRQELQKRVRESGMDEADLRARVESGIDPEAA
ncbi:MAG TPA: DUF4062 domain-containing protein [Solirubrobacterales bacterium]|nr:DUF4062 domain-containing protein [Solirubrobacterales bacterium]